MTKEQKYRATIRKLLTVIDSITFIDSKGIRYPGFVEDTPLNDMVDDDVAEAEKVLRPRPSIKKKGTTK